MIGNRVKGTDSVAIFEGGCTGYTEPTLFCQPNPDGSLSLRYMMTGSDFDDYLRVLDPGYRLQFLGYSSQDHGGVHYNSAIWNNALWSIRVQLAKIDGEAGNDSPLAQAFDRAVYGALTTRLGPDVGLPRRPGRGRAGDHRLPARPGRPARGPRGLRPEQDLRRLPGHRRARRRHRLGLAVHPAAPGREPRQRGLARRERRGRPVRLRGLHEGRRRHPVEGRQLRRGRGRPSAATPWSPSTSTARSPATRADGSATTLDQVQFEPAIAAGLAGSDAGAAWASAGDEVSFTDPAGQVTSARVQGLKGDTITGLGTGGGTVAIGTDGGRVFAWQPGGQPTQVGRLDGAVISAASYAGSVVAVDDAGTVALFTGDGQTFQLSSAASPFGVTMSDRYVVWAENKGPLEAGVAGGVSNYPDTDLYLLSLANGQIYDLVPGGGQQGFPSLSGSRLVWQDAAFGGDDVLTAVIPPDL